MNKSLTIGVPAESRAGEKRVALTPEDAGKLAAANFQIVVEKNAGVAAGFPDQDYKGIKGVKIGTAANAWGAALVLHVQPPTAREVTKIKKGATLISHIFASNHAAEMRALKQRGVNCLAMELIPRITRAQAMDSLSSQATISGYWSVLHGAANTQIFLPMITYAAGTIRPAKILVIGAGVAGLQAIATARRLGAIVEAFDVRPETNEQIASLGAKPVELGFDASGTGGYARELTKDEQKQIAEVLTRTLEKTDIVITTAGVPGRPSPKIISKAQVESMQPGSLIVDVVAESGGNCVLTKPGSDIQHKGVTISGPINIPSRLPRHASQMYSKNLMGMIGLLVQNHQPVVDTDDEIVADCLLLKDGKAVHPSLVVESKKTSSAQRKKTATTKTTAKAATGKVASSTKIKLTRATTAKLATQKTRKTATRKPSRAKPAMKPVHN